MKTDKKISKLEPQINKEIYDEICYAVYPGEVESNSDKDVHFISFKKLIGLYRVNPSLCFDMSQEIDRKIISLRSNVIHLRVRYDGDYSMEEHRDQGGAPCNQPIE